MKVLLIDKIHPILKETLIGQGHIVDELLDLSQESLAQKVSAYDGLILRSKFRVDKALIEKASQLKFIARAGAGMEHIDIDFAESKGITCINSPEGNAAAVAEHAIGMMLTLLHNIGRADSQMKRDLWDREANRGSELSYKTVGVLGAGNTGSELIKKLSGFDCPVISHDLIPSKVDETLAKSVSLAELKESADIISVHIPMNSENAHFVDAEFIKSFEKPIILINASRGAVLHTEEILDCLEEKKILGLGLDVFENEKPTTFSKEEKSQLERLKRHENVVITPHIAGWSHESEYKIADVLVKKILKLG